MKKRGKSFAGKVCGNPNELKNAKRMAYGSVWADAFTRAKNQASRLTPHEIKTFSDILRNAINALAECRGSEHEWGVLCGVTIQVEALGKVGVIKTGCAELVDAAQQTIEQAMSRQKATGSNVLRPIEITELMELADNWDLILGAVTVGEMNRSSEIAIRKRTEALAKGKAIPMVGASEPASCAARAA